MPSARTSVGNEEYEYKSKEKRADDRQQRSDRRGTVGIGGAAMAVALRHDPTLGQLASRRQQFHLKSV